MYCVDEQLRLSDFEYDLPESLIAQEPASHRDHSRLMILDRNAGSIRHRRFHEIGSFLRSGDLLIVNDTRVFPCRIPASRPGGGKAEVFLLSERSRNTWDALVRGGGRPGSQLSIGGGIRAILEAESGDGTWTVRFIGTEDMRAVLAEVAETPLPPYIKRRRPHHRDRERYQTVYAAVEGAVAAPTAGLHFTEELLSSLRSHGVEIVSITLHVGAGTFQPVRAERVADHRMHAERYRISPETALRINAAKRERRRVIAVGTTSVRAVESSLNHSGQVLPGEGMTSLFILPGFSFSVIDGLVTNFHLPRSSLLMLVSAFAGREAVLKAYREAVGEQYRFFSYGDAMLILHGSRQDEGALSTITRSDPRHVE